jgi:hypothetical protein
MTIRAYYYYSLFARYVHTLTEHGPELRGLCPFHEDSNPSFTANKTTGLWLWSAGKRLPVREARRGGGGNGERTPAAHNCSNLRLPR